MMKRFVLALLALLIASSALAATTKVVLNSTTWTSLGTGPLMVAASGAVVFSIDSATPTIPVNQGFPMGGAPQCINTTATVYAMAANAFPAWAFASAISGC
jgi:hypothetical protein